MLTNYIYSATMKLTSAELDDIETALTSLYRATFQHRAWEQLQKAAGTELDRASASLLKTITHLSSNNCRVQDLANYMGIEAPSVSRTAKELEDAGFLKRAQDNKDRRAFNLSLTSAGKAELQKFRRARRQKLSAVLADWKTEDRRDLARLLDKFGKDLLDPQSEQKV